MEKNKQSFFDENIDPECVPLIIALNNLDGVKTYESCCGHLKDTYSIWMRCNNLTSIAIIARTFDDRYSDGRWIVELETSDSELEGYKTFTIYLHTERPFKSWEEMIYSVNMACYHLNYWNEDKFKDHFNGIDEKEKEKKREERYLDNLDFKRLLEGLSYPDMKTKRYIMAKIDSLYGYSSVYIEETLNNHKIK